MADFRFPGKGKRRSAPGAVGAVATEKRRRYNPSKNKRYAVKFNQLLPSTVFMHMLFNTNIVFASIHCNSRLLGQ